MKYQVKKGVAIPINPYTDKEARKKWAAKRYPKYKVYEADGETPFPDTREIDLSDFKKVYKAGITRSVLVHLANQVVSTRKWRNFVEVIDDMDADFTPDVSRVNEIMGMLKQCLNNSSAI